MNKITDVGAAYDPQWVRVESRIEQLERKLAEAKEQLHLCNVDQFTTVAELAEAVAKERERCAKVCEEFYSVENIAQKCAEAIRKGE
jgi:uncharacterized coiled-coil protein SlyX